MNALLAFCGTCHQMPNSSGTQFFLTSCGNVICQKCLPRQSSCTKCGASCSKTLISNQMNANAASFFKDPLSDFQRLQRTMAFQCGRYKAYIKYSNARMAHFERTLQEYKTKMHSLEMENKALKASLAKSQERNNSLNSQRQPSREHQRFPVARSQGLPAPPNANDSQFMNNFMAAIDQQNPNDMINIQPDMEVSSYGIFPRETSRNSFDNTLNRSANQSGVASGLIPTNINPNPARSVRFASNIQTSRIIQSTPMIGHERVGLHNFGFRPGSNGSSSSLTRRPPSSIAGGNRYSR